MPSPTISRTAEPPEDWRAFAAANGTFYHRPEWALCLGEMYGLRLDYYSARQVGELCGLLAVAEIPPLFGPRRYVSLPFSYAAGPLAPDSDAAAQLSAAVLERGGEQSLLVETLQTLGMAQARQNRYQPALNTLKRAAEVAETAGDPRANDRSPTLRTLKPHGEVQQRRQ